MVAILTAFISVIGHFLGGNGSKKEVVLKEIDVDWCQQTYGIKTPPKYIQNQSTRKCFYPLVYTVLKGNEVTHYGSWFENDIYLRGYQLNIANLTKNHDLIVGVTIISEGNHIMFSCNKHSFKWYGNKVEVQEKIPYDKEIFCGIVIMSEKRLTNGLDIHIKNDLFESQQIPMSLWNADIIGFNLYYNNNFSKDIFKPMNDYYNEKGITRHEI